MRFPMTVALAIALIVCLTLIPEGIAFGQVRGDLSIAIGHMPGDPMPNLTVDANETNYLQLWIQNDNPLTGMEVPFEFFWPPGWTVNFNLNYAGAGRAVKAYGSAIGAFDLVFIENHYFDGTSSDSIYIGAAAIIMNLPAHSISTFCYEMEFTVSGTVATSGWPATLCIDNIGLPATFTWIFADSFGSYGPDYQGNANTAHNNPDAPPICHDIINRPPCGDVDCNYIVSISDAVYLINFIFAAGPAPCAACP